jgi:hypothetical protein
MKDQTVLELALRVLVAVTEGNEPDPIDLGSLRTLAPELFGAAADELACVIVGQLCTTPPAADIAASRERRKKSVQETQPI